jgi:TonB-dependent receptor
LNNKEDILNGGFNYAQKISFGSFKPELKAGVYYEKKQRDFRSRQLGYVLSSQSRMYFYPLESFNGKDGFDQEMFNSITEFFKSKIDFKTGMVVSDATQKADSYKAENELKAGYLAFNIPVTKWFNAYFGVRVESNRLTLDGFKRDGTDKTPINVSIDSVNVFPAFNASINLTDKMILRMASGKTVNRPEFREVSPFVFYSFDDNAIIYGNPDIVNSYINNSDIRFEWYPTSEEIVSLGVFYKDFSKPIESKILIAGSGWNYTFENADKAKSYGVELDVRKRLHEFENSGVFKFLSNITFAMNASLIKSVIKTDSIVEGASERVLQGQSPYIVNFGAYYNDIKSKFMTSIMYNITGERIAVVGDKDTPHIYEMPFNSLDFTIEKGITKWVNIKFGIKNILNDEVIFQQYQKYSDNGVSKVRTQINTFFKPGRQFKLGISVNL